MSDWLRDLPNRMTHPQGYIDALVAENSALRAERDALKEQLRIAEDRLAVARLDRNDMFKAATAQEAQLAEAVRLLREALAAVIWMSGSPSFGKDGEAHEGWVVIRDEQMGEWFAFLARLDGETP